MPEPEPSGRRAAWSGRKVLVTGASGFIGSALCDSLVAAGAEVSGISRRQQAEGAVRWYRGDVADPDAVRAVFSSVEPDVVYHLASDSRSARTLEMVPITFRANLASSVAVLTAAAEAGRPRVVLAGSQEEPFGSGDAVSSSPYALTKWASTQYARMFGELYDLPVVCLRIFMTYGPGQMDLAKLLPYSILKLLRGEAPEIDSGSRRVDWIFIEDVVEALHLAGIREGVAGHQVAVGSGVAPTIRELVDLLAEKIAPGRGVIDRNRSRPAEQSVTADPEEGFRLLGWRPRVPLSEGLDRTIAWYRSREPGPARAVSRRSGAPESAR